MDTFAAVTNNFSTTFAGFSHQFLVWGECIFGGLLVINFAWIFLWYAFDKDCFSKSLSSFLKRFMIIMIFYTLMLNPNWLFSILSTVHFMGKTITGIPLDPSSVISKGIELANKTIAPIATSSLLTLGFSAVIILIVYLVINFTFITIGLDLALTLITTTALISISAFFLGFSALGATSNIARQTLDIILGNCFRVLGIYLVVGAGSHTIETIMKAIPTETISFDQYVWVMASCLLFWLLAKNFPNQLARIASIAVQDNQGTDSAAIATSSLRMGAQLGQAAKVAQTAFAASGIPQLAKVAASTTYNAVMQVAKNKKEGSSILGSVAKGGITTGVDMSKATFKTLGDHIAHAANKSAGGQGIANSHAHIPSVAERIYSAADRARMQMPTTVHPPKQNAENFPNDANQSHSTSTDTSPQRAGNNNPSIEDTQSQKSCSTLTQDTVVKATERNETIKTSSFSQTSKQINPSEMQHDTKTNESTPNKSHLSSQVMNEETANWNQPPTTQEG